MRLGIRPPEPSSRAGAWPATSSRPLGPGWVSVTLADAPASVASTLETTSNQSSPHMVALIGSETTGPEADRREPRTVRQSGLNAVKALAATNPGARPGGWFNVTD